MKKDNNILYYGVFFAASILAELYCIIEKINIIGVSIVILIATYLFLDAIRNERNREEEHREEYFGGRLEEIEKIQKALYVQMKKNIEITVLKLDKIQAVQSDGIQQIVDSQNKMAKIIVKYTREDFKKATAIEALNAEKVIAAITQSRDNSNLNFKNLIDHFESSIRDIEKELVKQGQLSDNLRFAQVMQNTVPVMQTQTINPLPISPKEEKEEKEEPDPISELLPVEEEVMEEPEPMPELLPVEEEIMEEEPEPMPELLPMEEEIMEEEPEPMPELLSMEEEIMEEPKPLPVAEAIDLNKQLSPEEIAAMFASSEPEAKEEAAPTIVTPVEEKADPNKQLSADEIAAMFAAMDDSSTAKEEAKSEPEPVPAAADSNKQLSADEIAALFASIG